ncbi:MAG: hypothetical protein NTZ59_12710 [Bacteroidetes bacterium]|nr:hypothetical protein [Bacteroidota bacterium]
MTNKNEDTIINLIAYLSNSIKFLIGNWWKILIVGIGLGFSAIIYLTIIEKQSYKATLTFVSENTGSEKIGGYAGIAAQFGIDLGQGGANAFEGDNLLEIFKSRMLIESTLLSKCCNDDKETLLETYIRNHNITKEKLNYNSLHNNRKVDSIISVVYKKIVMEQLTIERKDKKVTLIVLEMVDLDEVFAKNFIETLSNITVKFYSSYKTKKSYQNLQILQNQADSLYNLITGKIYSVAESVDLNLNPSKQVVRVPTQRKNIDLNVATAVYTEVLKQLELAKITFRKETPLIQIIDTPILPLKKMRMGKLTGGIIFFSLGVTIAVITLLVKNTIKRIKTEDNLV